MQIGVVVVIFDQGHILLGRRLKPSGYGLYAVPGGKPEFGETFEETAIREVEEECGLPIGVNGLIHYVDTMSDDGPWRTFFYAAYPKNANYMHGEAVVFNKEPEYCAGWEWHSLDSLPQNLWEMNDDLLLKIRTWLR